MILNIKIEQSKLRIDLLLSEGGQRQRVLVSVMGQNERTEYIKMQ